MEKKKGFSLLKFIIVLLCLILIAASVVVNVFFAGGKTPKILDNYIYIVKESDNMGSMVNVGSALVSPDAKNLSIAKGDIVLCKKPGSSDLSLCSIYNIDIDDGGIAHFVTADASNVPSEDTITKDAISAVCTGHLESAELGQLITFAQTLPGIIALLVIPCVILVILLIAKIVSSKEDDVIEDNFDFYEYDGDDKKKKNAQPKKPASHEKKSSSPLFEPSQEIQPSDDLERKKMSIAENFSQKKVNPNSPYQKEKERTMQFKAQMAAKQEPAPNNSPAPTADTLRDEILKKNEKTNTGSFGAIKPLDRPAQQPVEAKPAEPAAKPKQSSSPDISDIIKKSENSARKKKADEMSVDDLLKLIEDEKKKL